MFKFEHSFNKMANMVKAKTMLEALPEKIEWVQSIEVGFDFSRGSSAYDLCLRATFLTKDHLIWFKAEPARLEAMQFLKEVSEASHVVDYEVDDL
jgi:hypothetical protein